MDAGELGVISVVFENRPDGGIRVYSDDVPGFVLSHADKTAFLSDVRPALETIIGEMVGYKVLIVPIDQSKAFSWGPERESKRFWAKRAA